MNRPLRAKITAIGTYVPPRRLTNEDLSRMVETNDEWIRTRTGVVERHIVEPGMATSDMAVLAAERCLSQRGVRPEEVEAVIVATVTPDMLFPSTACLVQHRLGAPHCWGFDVVAACSGFLYALTAGAHLVNAGSHRKVLVIGADTMSSIIDYTDRATCVLFGDGAGAVLLEPSDDGEQPGFLDYVHHVDGSGGGNLYMPAGGSRRPASRETVDQREHFVHQEGQAVFRYAVVTMAELCQQILNRNGLQAADVDCFIPHQANRRIIENCCERTGIGMNRTLVNIDKYGNTTAATIPLGFEDAVNSGMLHRGNLVLLAAVGAGYTAGVQLLRWAL